MSVLPKFSNIHSTRPLCGQSKTAAVRKLRLLHLYSPLCAFELGTVRYKRCSNSLTSACRGTLAIRVLCRLGVVKIRHLACNRIAPNVYMSCVVELAFRTAHNQQATLETDACPFGISGSCFVCLSLKVRMERLVNHPPKVIVKPQPHARQLGLPQARKH